MPGKKEGANEGPLLKDKVRYTGEGVAAVGSVVEEYEFV
jgi:hypothetical protein